jgi:hypothetical protein
LRWAVQPLCSVWAGAWKRGCMDVRKDLWATRLSGTSGRERRQCSLPG